MRGRNGFFGLSRIRQSSSFVGCALALSVLTGCSTRVSLPDTDDPLARDECVVLMHGLWRSNLAMLPLEWSLVGAGYSVVNVDYDSTGKTLFAMADEDLQPGVEQCEALVSGPVHLVTHSMGGIVARVYLQNRELPRGGRVVMLSPPNQGSLLVTRFSDYPLAETVLGPAALELKQPPEGSLGRLQALTVDVGVIAGASNAGWTSWLPGGELPEPHDGTVTVASTLLPEMRDFRTVVANHVSIRHSEEAFELIQRFLEQGDFGSN